MRIRGACRIRGKRRAETETGRQGRRGVLRPGREGCAAAWPCRRQQRCSPSTLPVKWAPSLLLRKYCRHFGKRRLGTMARRQGASRVLQPGPCRLCRAARGRLPPQLPRRELATRMQPIDSPALLLCCSPAAVLPSRRSTGSHGGFCHCPARRTGRGDGARWRAAGAWLGEGGRHRGREMGERRWGGGAKGLRWEYLQGRGGEMAYPIFYFSLPLFLRTRPA